MSNAQSEDNKKSSSGGLRSMTMHSLGCHIRAAQERASQQFNKTLKQTADKDDDKDDGLQPGFEYGPTGTKFYEDLHMSENDEIAVFYRTIITLGQRIACPCGPENIRTLNRFYKVVFGKDMPESVTRIYKDRQVMKNTLEPYLIQAAIKAGTILHENADTEKITTINKLLSRVYITHPQFC